jgi:hypothetical protein
MFSFFLHVLPASESTTFFHRFWTAEKYKTQFWSLVGHGASTHTLQRA